MSELDKCLVEDGAVTTTASNNSERRHFVTIEGHMGTSDSCSGFIGRIEAAALAYRALWLREKARVAELEDVASRVVARFHDQGRCLDCGMHDHDAGCEVGQLSAALTPKEPTDEK